MLALPFPPFLLSLSLSFPLPHTHTYTLYPIITHVCAHISRSRRVNRDLMYNTHSHSSTASGYQFARSTSYSYGYATWDHATLPNYHC